MLGLRTSDGVALPDMEAGFARQCAEAGYAVADGGRFRLTPRGFLVSNQIIGRALELAEDSGFADGEKKTCAAASETV